MKNKKESEGLWGLGYAAHEWKSGLKSSIGDPFSYTPPKKKKETKEEKAARIIREKEEAEKERMIEDILDQIAYRNYNCGTDEYELDIRGLAAFLSSHYK